MHHVARDVHLGKKHGLLRIAHVDAVEVVAHPPTAIAQSFLVLTDDQIAGDECVLLASVSRIAPPTVVHVDGAAGHTVAPAATGEQTGYFEALDDLELGGVG